MKFIYILILSIFIPNSLSLSVKTRLDRCRDLQLKNPDLEINCDHLNTSKINNKSKRSFLQDKVSNYISEMKEIYHDYMSNNQNKVFMSKISEHISNLNMNRQKVPKSAYKFLERDVNYQDFDYSGLLKPDKPHLLKDFTKSLESPKLHQEIKRQSDYLNNNNNRNLLTRANDLLNEEYALASKDNRVKDEGNKLYSAIHDFAREHVSDFQDSRFLSVTGKSVEDPSSYVTKEIKYMNKNHLNDNIFNTEMKIESIDKLLDVDKFLKH